MFSAQVVWAVLYFGTIAMHEMCMDDMCIEMEVYIDIKIAEVLSLLRVDGT